MVRNILHNAIKYTPSKGTIAISERKLEKGLNIIVEDAGTGIPSNRVKNLFKKNFRSSTPGTLNEEGSGIGLLLCSELTKKVGGK